MLLEAEPLPVIQLLQRGGRGAGGVGAKVPAKARALSQPGPCLRALGQPENAVVASWSRLSLLLAVSFPFPGVRGRASPRSGWGRRLASGV